jgi:nitrogen fixation protein FixH
VKVVIAVIATVVLGVVAATIWVASRSYERTVVADPYESGIHHDRDRRRAEALGWTLVVDEDQLHAGPEAVLAVKLSDKGGAPLDGASVTFRVSRPGTIRFDRSAPARPEGRGRYVAVLPMTEAGFWDLDVVIQRAGESLTLGTATRARRAAPPTWATCASCSSSIRARRCRSGSSARRCG